MPRGELTRAQLQAEVNLLRAETDRRDDRVEEMCQELEAKKLEDHQLREAHRKAHHRIYALEHQLNQVMDQLIDAQTELGLIKEDTVRPRGAQLELNKPKE